MTWSPDELQFRQINDSLCLCPKFCLDNLLFSFPSHPLRFGWFSHKFRGRRCCHDSGNVEWHLQLITTMYDLSLSGKEWYWLLCRFIWWLHDVFMCVFALSMKPLKYRIMGGQSLPPPFTWGYTGQLSDIGMDRHKKAHLIANSFPLINEYHIIWLYLYRCCFPGTKGTPQKWPIARSRDRDFWGNRRDHLSDVDAIYRSWGSLH